MVPVIFLALFHGSALSQILSHGDDFAEVRSTDIDNIWTTKWQQCGSNRGQNTPGHKRTTDPPHGDFFLT